MDRKIKITYDYDDVLTGFNDHCIEKLNIDSKLVTRFEINKTKLSDIDKKRLLEIYRDLNTYKHAKWYEGIDETVRISKDPRVDFKVHSHAISNEIGEYKEQRLLSIGFNKECIYMQYGPEKKMEDTDVIVEDRILNVLSSNGRYKILINHYWNQEEYHQEFLKYFDSIARANDLVHANKMVKEIIEKWSIEQYS